ncbi:hypothetical protein H4R18_003540 [Coemansia javaensis]|uniref:Sm domain-containing protein n=1 Tax=Coemansia javaensis TaxID=2761396 RepID=A0A9W8LIF8_9FUNG|nr:hypothetical protein H4R18_003540 [Coemansia javaensis]
MSDCAKHPDLFTDSDKKETLARLRRRARHLDRKWVIGRGEPIKGFTLLGLIPVFGSMTGSALAIGYLREIRRTVALPDNLTFDMIKNILLYTAVTMVPVIGWIGKRVFGVNKRNYSILEEYLMSAQPCQEKPEERGIFGTRERFRADGAVIGSQLITVTLEAAPGTAAARAARRVAGQVCAGARAQALAKLVRQQGLVFAMCAHQSMGGGGAADPRASESGEPAISKKEQLRGYLNHRMRISCNDGRWFSGIFRCVDGQQNIILADTTEIRNDFRRGVGMIMVPGVHIRRILVENLECI